MKIQNLVSALVIFLITACSNSQIDSSPSRSNIDKDQGTLQIAELSEGQGSVFGGQDCVTCAGGECVGCLFEWLSTGKNPFDEPDCDWWGSPSTGQLPCGQAPQPCDGGSCRGVPPLPPPPWESCLLTAIDLYKCELATCSDGFLPESIPTTTIAEAGIDIVIPAPSCPIDVRPSPLANCEIWAILRKEARFQACFDEFATERIKETPEQIRERWRRTVEDILVQEL